MGVCQTYTLSKFTQPMYSTQLLEQSTSTLPRPPCCWNLDFFEYTLDIPHAKSAHEAPVRSSRSRSNHYWFENIAINLYRLFDGREDEHDHAGNHNKVKDHQLCCQCLLVCSTLSLGKAAISKTYRPFSISTRDSSFLD